MSEKPEALWICTKKGGARGRRTRVFRTREAARNFYGVKKVYGWSSPERATWGPES